MAKLNHTHYDSAEARTLKNSAIPAAVMASDATHFDSADDASIFFARELDYVKSQSYDVEYPELRLCLFSLSHPRLTPVLRPSPTTPTIRQVWRR